MSPGRYELIARLYRNEELQNEDRIHFAIDRSAPSIARIAVGSSETSLRPIAPTENVRHRTDQPLSVRFEASDAEAGLADMRVGIDVNRDGQLGDDEPQLMTSIDPFDGFQRERVQSFVFEPKQLPQTAGAYPVLITATNRLKMINPMTKQTIEFYPPAVSVKPPESTPPPAPTTGSITIVATRGPLNVEIKGPTSAGPIKLKLNESRQLDDLAPGTYTFDWKAYNDAGSSSVTINAGDAKTATVGQ